MKKTAFFLFLILVSSVTFAQKKDKIKGSKIVTIQQKQIEDFNSLEVFDNLEIFLVKGNQCGVEIEADDNLHDAIEIVVTGNTLRLSTLKNITGAKKLSIRVTYKDDFKLVVAKNESQITALSDIELQEIELRGYDYSKMFINAKTSNFIMQNDDKSKAEINLKSEKARITLSKNANIKALIVSTDLTFDMYQKSDATIEGDVAQLKLRLDNNASFIGNKLTSDTTEIIAESYSNAKINVSQNLTIEASGKAEIQLFGEPKIEIIRFTDSCVLMKKPTK